MASRVGLAVFGPGSMGVVHVQNILMSSRASLKWIVRNRKQEGEQFLKERGIDAGCTTPDNLGPVLEDPSVHGVVICSPSSSHEATIKSSLEAGKAVFCEKPITTDLESTGKCYDLAEKQGLPLLCAFNRRFDPSFKALRDRVKSGELGGLRMVRTSSRDHTPPPSEYLKSSGGIFFDTVIHDIDITSWVVGSRPSKVFSQGHASSPHFSDCNDIDLQVTSIFYENGVIGILDNLRQSLYGYDQRLEAVCEKGMVTVANRPVDLVTEHGPSLTSAPRVGKTFQHRYPEAYAAELDHFVDVIQGKAQLSITKEETLQAMRLADACKESFNSGQPVSV